MNLKFGDKVKIKSGFYEGIKGIVIDYKFDISNKYEYYLKAHKAINKYVNQKIKIWISEDKLEKI